MVAHICIDVRKVEVFRISSQTNALNNEFGNRVEEYYYESYIECFVSTVQLYN
jgi:hypothetical protein